ncbi:hypothetical protein JTE90_001900 [Oedothorax gibbosus]|uniref:Sodium/calcium exchanger membrane region domain-containing protein n=1 Tax=Oedothorax gibbosus TaxID=931172 RepID=A0AAV6VW74_9ARAC|nr:hypothetical protein JTE90_001900 [Oedothorax gibbosus]
MGNINNEVTMSKRKDVLASITVLYVATCLIYHLYSTIVFSSHKDLSLPLGSHDRLLNSPIQRKLLNVQEPNNTGELVSNVTCSKPDIEQFPRPLISYDARRKGGLLLHIFLSLYMCLGLAIICDEYFVPSLEKMCDLLNIQSDVAGATFMAGGSSAPELATAVIAVFVAKDDIGIGTVVGSAVYNITFVIGICGVFAGRAIYLNWWPMVRDCIFYLISILVLLFALQDEEVTWVESVVFLSLYASYILFMFFNQRLEKFVKSRNLFSRLCCQESEPINGVAYHSLPQGLMDNSSKLSNDISLESPIEESSSSSPSKEEEESSVFQPPKGKWRRILWATSLPFLICCYLTIPDCRKEKWGKLFFLTFLSSCVWIGICSYILVWMITIIGFTLNIKDTIMGLTFLAVGASIPDAISSLIVAREGLGDMAVSNAVGSNVFDILICLGLPWFLKTTIVEPGSTVSVGSRGLSYSTLTLLLTVVLLLVATHLNKWKLDKCYGIILLACYEFSIQLLFLFKYIKPCYNCHLELFKIKTNVQFL